MLITIAVTTALTLYHISDAAFVDPQYKLAEWDGWGTTMMYWSDFLGGQSQPVQDEIIYHLFSPEQLNLNILRYVIGGTTPGDEGCGGFNEYSAPESFRDGLDRPCVWTRDPRSRQVLLAAKAMGADTFEARSRSPPSWMTRSGCTQGNPEGAPLHDNFDPKYANAFADYLTEVVKYYYENYNITFASLEPFFEPTSGKWHGTEMYREGCGMGHSTMVEVIKSLATSIETKNLTFCSISAADDTGILLELATQTYFTEAGVSPLYNRVSALFYLEGQPEATSQLYSLASRNHHSIWISGKYYAGAQFPNVTHGVSIAAGIISDLRTLSPSAWVYWEVLRNYPTTDGLMHVPWDNATVENVRITSGYYAMMQFSKYIRKGFTLIHVSDSDSIAAYHQTLETLIIVTVNSELSETTKTFDLRHFAPVTKVHAFRTSDFEPHVPVQSPTVVDNQFSYEFPALSVTTFKTIVAVNIQNDNLIRNGNFESGEGDPWFLQYGIRDDNGVNGDYTRSGEYSGFLDSTESKLELVQTVNVNQSGTYYLSAWCATTGPSTRLGVLINGIQGPEAVISPSTGYQIYGLSVDASPTDLLSIYFHIERGNHTAQIDDVSMY